MPSLGLGGIRGSLSGSNGNENGEVILPWLKSLEDERTQGGVRWALSDLWVGKSTHEHLETIAPEASTDEADSDIPRMRTI